VSLRIATAVWKASESKTVRSSSIFLTSLNHLSIGIGKATFFGIFTVILVAPLRSQHHATLAPAQTWPV